MSTIVSSIASEPQPLEGQKHRSSYNFQLLSNDGQTLVVQSAPGVTFDIKQDVKGHDPTPVSNASNGTELAGNTLEIGKNYYIANPEHAQSNFVVTLVQSELTRA